MFDKNNLKICYIGGGSRAWAWVLMKDLCFEKEISGTIRLFDLNTQAARDNEIIAGRLLEKHNPGKWKFTTAESLQTGLDGADFVFISIQPGGYDYMEADVHEPEKYGIWQSVGDTTGPGGMIRAMRTIPAYQEIARAVKEYAPEAWVINYTNPMTICTRTLYTEFPEIKAFGCCHEVFSTQKMMRQLIEREGLAEPGTIRREEIRTNVLGINHFTWIDRASWHDMDLFPLYQRMLDDFYETGYHHTGDDNWMNNHFKSAERVKMDLFKRYGIIAAAGDRHLAEFCPPSWYLSSPETVAHWMYSLTPVAFRIKKKAGLDAKCPGYKDGTDMLKPEPSGEEGIAQMKALLGLGDFVTNVNMPNKGQMPDLPHDAVVETNAFFSRGDIQPVITKGLPTDIRSMVMHHVINQEGIIEAARKCSLDKAFRVFLNDMAVRTLPIENAKTLFDTMTRKTLHPSLGYK